MPVQPPGISQAMPGQTQYYGIATPRAPRDFKVDKAFDMLKAHFAWREEVMPMSLGEKDLPSTFNCGVLRYIGESKFGTSTNISLSSFFEVRVPPCQREAQSNCSRIVW